MRVISKADGELLEGHSGSYVFGGSWFLNDGANYLDGLIHGMDPDWVDLQLLWRLEKELAWMPAFHESDQYSYGKTSWPSSLLLELGVLVAAPRDSQAIRANGA